MIWKQMIIASLPLVLVSGLVAWKGYPPPVSTPLSLNNIKLDCSEPPGFIVGYKQDEASLIPLGQGFRFQGVSWLTADVCSSGTLQLTAEGEIADHQAPIIQIALNSEILTAQAIDQRQNVNVRVPRKGRLTLGYFNDYYLADVRVATLRNPMLSGPLCKTLSGLVPKETGGGWIPENQTATLVSDVPMTITPCAAGELSLQVVGRSGLEEYPILVFKQGGVDRLRVETGKNFQRIQLKIAASPLTIILSNPYGKTLADRNLNLYSVKFVPDKMQVP